MIALRHLPTLLNVDVDVDEPIIKAKYIAKQLETGHTGIKVSEKGLIIDRKNPLLAASIDGEVYDPTAKHSPVGNLEMK